jgi:hypothetical protein
MALNLQVANTITSTAQSVQDQNGNTTALALSTKNVGIGTTNPTQALTLGSGNMFLPYGVGALDGNLFFGGNTDAGQVGLRLFAIDAAGEFQCGFIDVRAGTVTDGLVFAQAWRTRKTKSKTAAALVLFRFGFLS